ncbi:MAG: PEP-CTERM sorting domain-containing protein [Burkholderiaceae bacterium]|nr:PEP-CTERM sorting domain-containing protein [Burkholderiaceae bacterium]
MKTLSQLAGAAALLLGAVSAQAAGSLVITPVDSNVNPGDSFALLVSGSGFSDKVVGGGLNLSFDASVLSLTSVTVDTVVWEFVSSNGLIDNAAGTLSDVYFNSFKAQLPTGDFKVATLQFSAKAGGSSAIMMSDSPNFPFANDLAEVVSVSYQGAMVNVSAVPEPGSWALLLGGLTAIGWLVRGRRS